MKKYLAIELSALAKDLNGFINSEHLASHIKVIQESAIAEIERNLEVKLGSF